MGYLAFSKHTQICGWLWNWPFTFRVVYWVLGVSAVGAILLWRTVPAAASEYKNKPGGPDRIRGLLWCFGASLNRLLPIIELHEFKGIFEDPDKAGFKLWQRNAFSILSLVGWILGGVLILAISGLTQNTWELTFSRSLAWSVAGLLEWTTFGARNQTIWRLFTPPLPTIASGCSRLPPLSDALRAYRPNWEGQ